MHFFLGKRYRVIIKYQENENKTIMYDSAFSGLFLLFINAQRSKCITAECTPAFVLIQNLTNYSRKQTVLTCDLFKCPNSSTVMSGRNRKGRCSIFTGNRFSRFSGILQSSLVILLQSDLSKSSRGRKTKFG